MRSPTGEDRQALDRYLAEVALEPILMPAQEHAFAQDIARLRGAWWSALLSHPPWVQPLVDRIERELSAATPAPLEAAVLAELCAASRALRDRNARDRRARYELSLATAAEALTWADPEGVVASRLSAEIERAATGHRVDARAALRPPPVASRPFALYRQRIARARAELEGAKRAFVRANLRLVIATAKHYNHGILSLTDLIQEGNIGLLKAVDRFDPRRGTRFSTFAVWWIRHKITRALANQGRTIRLPVHVTVDNMNLRKADKKLVEQLGREPTDEELAQVVQMSVERVALTRRAVRARPISTATPLEAEGVACVQDLLCSEGTEDEFARIEAGRDCERLNAALSRLSPMERDILRRRFGLTDGEEHTLAEIGEAYKLSRERIRQLQNRALQRLRGELELQAPAA